MFESPRWDLNSFKNLKICYLHLKRKPNQSKPSQTSTMFKVSLLVALAIAGAYAQEAAVETAPEPYNYAYDSGTHAAAEQKDQSGKVTGYYTIVDADGRNRRVDYVADEGGFRAKVQTNEVGTKSENSADVEVLAQPPNAEQFAASVETTGYRQQAYTVQQPQAVYQTQQVLSAPKKVASAGVQYVQQPYGYSTGYSYNPGSYYGANQYGYSGYAAPAYGAYYGSGNTGVYGGYQTVAAPAVTASYYRQTVQPASYSTSNLGNLVGGAAVSRYTTAQAPVATGAYRYQAVGVGAPGTVAYHTSGVGPASYGNVVTVPQVTTGYRYKTAAVGVPAAATYQTPAVPAATVGVTGNPLGSSNYIVLKK